MNLDVRIPIGGMFGISGVLLILYGLLTLGDAMYQKSLGHNINIYWGLAMAVFGGLMFFFGWRAKNRPPTTTTTPTERRGH